MDFVTHLLLAFIPLFVAADPVGLAAMFAAMTRHMTEDQARKVAIQAVFTAFGVGLGFMFLGQAIFSVVGITVGDFQIAGGLVLFFLSAQDLLGYTHAPTEDRDDIAIVPLGMPLIAGPAMITALLSLSKTVGLFPTLTALTAIMMLTALLFIKSRLLKKIIGVKGLKAFSKIIHLLLIAIAVNMIRHGIENFIRQTP
ncbi:MarC family protein [bacterium]|nr:MarC family protein [bacterium]